MNEIVSTCHRCEQAYGHSVRCRKKVTHNKYLKMMKDVTKSIFLKKNQSL